MKSDELKKVKVLKIIKEHIKVSGNEYLKAQDVKSTELKNRIRLAKDLKDEDFK